MTKTRRKAVTIQLFGVFHYCLSDNIIFGISKIITKLS